MPVFRTDAHVARDALDASFVLLTTGSGIGLNQRGRQASVGVDRFSMVSASDVYTYVQSTRSTFDNLILPGRLVRQFAPRIDDRVAVASGGGTLDRLFYENATSLCQGFEAVAPQAREVIGHQRVELLGLVLDGADETSAATPIRRAHYRRVFKLIDREFTVLGSKLTCDR